MEHVLDSNIMNHGETNSILYPLQHGFRFDRSCETQLIEFIDDLISNLEEVQQTDILIMDFVKAFDKVHYSLLIHKLPSLRHQRRGKQLDRRNWLSDRKKQL